MVPRALRAAMMLPPWAAFCGAERDCGCCGARGALYCVEPPTHAATHAFVCRACGRDKDC